MIELEPVQPNSRRGYPVREGTGVRLFDEPQFDGHAFLPGFTLPNLDQLNVGIPVQIKGMDIASDRNLEFGIVRRLGSWVTHEIFEDLAEHYRYLLSACEASPRAIAIEAYTASLSQASTVKDVSTNIKAGAWHFDYPWVEETGWFTLVTNVDVTEVSLEEHTFSSGIKVENVDQTKIWRPEPGEVITIDTRTAHRRPRCYRRKVPRTLLNVEPQYTRRGTPRKAKLAMLAFAEIDDFSDVPINEIIKKPA